ncbi:MAG: hypothetical protein FWF95_03735 [Syntrophorhabdaceae bacterium]|nr:hypothetical protein [Syntrophorhabdaceae bacterium]
MERNILAFFLCIMSFAAVFAGCGPANQLLIPDGISRPPVVDPPVPELSGIKVAVMDFSYTPTDEPKVIGRDYDRARQIVWEGDPGSLMAGLVADALSERGVPVSRLKPGDPVTDDFSSVIKGTVRRFGVDIRRRNIVNVYIDTTIELAISVSGRSVPVPWETSVSSNAVTQEVFPLPDNIREALSSAANSAADEAARRLREKGVAGTSR